MNNTYPQCITCGVMMTAPPTTSFGMADQYCISCRRKVDEQSARDRRQILEMFREIPEMLMDTWPNMIQWLIVLVMIFGTVYTVMHFIVNYW